MQRRSHSFRRALTFRLERLLVRGIRYKLLFVALVILGLALLGGALAYLVPGGDFDRPRHAVWWAFLRLSDSGYLADDDAPGLRVVAVALTAAGLVAFVGGLVAILTQWLSSTIDRLDLGLTPIAASGHLVILGWTNRTTTLLSRLVASDRVDATAKIVVLAERVTTALRLELRERLGVRYDDRRIILRTGDPQQLDHLERVACARARAIIIPGRDFAPDGPQARDPSTLKVIANLDASVEGDGASRPRLAAELFDPSLVAVGTSVYRGGATIVPSDTVVGRSVALAVCSPGLSRLLPDLLNPAEAPFLVIQQYPDLAGATALEATTRFHDSILLGPLRHAAPDEPREIDPSPDAILTTTDHLVLLAPRPTPPHAGGAQSVADVASLLPANDATVTTWRRLLLLGWSGKAPDLLSELTRDTSARYAVDVLSRRSVSVRETQLGTDAGISERLEIQHLVGSPTTPSHLRQLPLSTYDSIVALAADDAADVAAADSGTIASFLVADHLLQTAARRPAMLVELLDGSNVRLLQGRDVEVVVSPLILADITAGVVCYPEVEDVIGRFLAGGPGRARVSHATDFAPPGSTIDLRSLDHALRKMGTVLLAAQRRADGHRLEFLLDRATPFEVSEGDRLVLVTRRPM